MENTFSDPTEDVYDDALWPAIGWGKEEDRWQNSAMNRDNSTSRKTDNARHKLDAPALQTGTDTDPLLTPNDVAARLNVTTEQVRSLIRAGRLRAINVGTGSKRPLYRLTAEVVEDFIKHGSCNRTPRIKRRAKQLGRVPDFFPRLK